jgi:hypothetical protein
MSRRPRTHNRAGDAQWSMLVAGDVRLPLIGYLHNISVIGEQNQVVNAAALQGSLHRPRDHGLTTNEV